MLLRFLLRSSDNPAIIWCGRQVECASGYCFSNLLGQKTCAPPPAGDCSNQFGPAMPCEESSDPRWDRIYGVELCEPQPLPLLPFLPPWPRTSTIIFSTRGYLEILSLRKNVDRVQKC